jgi:hypothetical protein
VGKDRVVTNFQALLREWKEQKIPKYDVNFQECLCQYKREEYDLAQQQRPASHHIDGI